MEPTNNLKLMFVSLLVLVSINASRSHVDNTTTRKLLAAAAVDPQIKKICDGTDHPDLCLSTVAPVLNGKKIDEDSVLQVAVQAGEQFAKNAYNLVKDLSSKPGTSPQVLSTLKDCKYGYETAVENYDESLASLPVHDIGTVRSKLSGILTWIGDCEDGFTSVGEPSPLTTFAEKLTSMTSNCLAITDQMVQ